MKKVYGIILLALLVLLPGCTKVEEGKYKEGTYIGVDEANKQIAVVYVDKSGLIKSVFIDAAYGKKQADGTTISTTKQILKDGYGMKSASANMGIIEGGAEWFEQADNFSKKVVDEQGIDWFEYKYRIQNTDGTYSFTSEKPANQTEADKLYTDTVSGVTIHVNGTYNAVKNALDQAKK
jgi:major membrane immunogen (membrane-anchored lipoprotein)